MAVEDLNVMGFEMVQGPAENGTALEEPVLHEKENGKLDQEPGVPSEPINSGSHGDEPVKGEAENASESNTPKNAVDEWPAPKQVYSFYFIRHRPYDDPKIKAKIDQADKQISELNKARIQILDKLKEIRANRAETISQLKVLREGNRSIQSIMDEKRKEMEPLQQALSKLRNANNAGRGSGLCSSEEELNDLINSLNYRMQHESIPLAEEKQILREIKQLESTRDKVVANAAMRAKIQESMGQKEVIQDQVKLIGGDLDGVRKEKQANVSKIKQYDEEIKEYDKNINALQEELTVVTNKREKTYEAIQQLRKQRDEGNTHFYQSRTFLNKARELAAKKDIKALEELSHSEVDKFMSLWSNDKAFRDDYEKRILPSLDSRQMSRDGRIRNPDEKPLLAPEEPKPSESNGPVKAISKQPKEQPKEDSKNLLQESVPTSKVQKEGKNKPREEKPTMEDSAPAETKTFELDKPQAPSKPEIDPEKLKEIRREEEIAKAKLAMERKKKLAEKAAAKAAIRAQKEAEKKLKEREKKAKKKASVSEPVTDSEQPLEAAEEAPEQEKVNENVEAPALVKEKVRKENAVRSRVVRSRGANSVPKVILKRKRSNSYWMWAASSAAAVSAVLVLLLVYNYVL